MQNVFQVLTVVVVLGTIQNPASGKALQFNADGFIATEDTATWNAGWDSNAMTSVHAATNEIYIGGAPATAAWTQSWSGGIVELILLAETPTEEELDALRRYLALKHGLAVPTESNGAIVSTLSDMGIDTAGLFNSVFLVR